MRPTFSGAPMLCVIACSTVMVAAAATAVSNPAWVRDQFELDPRPAGDLTDALVIAGHNLGLAILLFTLPRMVPSAGPGKVVDAIVILTAITNLVLAGAAVGAYGMDLGLRFGIYAPLELAAFTVAASAYFVQRRSTVRLDRAALAFVLILLLVSSCLEALLPAMAPPA